MKQATMKHPQQTSAAEATPIAVIGMSCLFPDAGGLKEYWRLLRRSEDAVREVPRTHFNIDDYYDADPRRPDHIYCRRGAFLQPVRFDPLEFGIPPAILEATDTAQLLSLIVAKQALQDAGYGQAREFDRTRASVILGVTGTQELVIPLGARLGHPQWRRALENAGASPQMVDRVLRELSESYVGWQENSFPGLLGNVVAGRVASRLNLKGTNCVVDAACASSLSAMHMAAMELAAGRCDIALSGGVDTLNDIFMFMCFARTQALSASGDARPFAADSDGTVLGEGVGMLVLKRLADAERDGDRIHAVLRAIGTSSDGRSQSIYAPRAEGQAIALREAYTLSGVDPTTVELVEAHGTGTRVGDVVEFEALRTVYEEAAERAEPTSGERGAWCALGSVKSQIGHTKAAAGAASMIKAILALRNRVLPGTIKIAQANPKLNIENSPFYLNTETRPWFSATGKARRAAVSSFGFGGSNFHAVLEEYPQATREPAWDGSVEIIALSGDDAGAIRRQLSEWRRDAVRWRDALAVDAPAPAARIHEELARRAFASRQAFRGDAACRMAIVAEWGADLVALVESAEKLLAQFGAQQAWMHGNIFFGGPGAPGEVALLFPGQGSQYVGMCREVVCVFPEAHDAIARADEAGPGDRPVSTLIYPPPTFDAAQREKHEVELRRTEAAQPAIGAVSAAMLRVLERHGIRAHVLGGHSFGELVALHAAGCFDERTLHQLARLRGETMRDADDGQGAMLAVHAPLEEIDSALREQGFDVVLANRNAPSQGVVSGSRRAIERVREFFELKGWRTKLLQVSAAFHSRFMEDAQRRYRAALDRFHIEPPNIPVFANASGRPYPLDPCGIRDLLADQLARPVHFVDEIKHMYEAGVRTFIEVGPKNVLTGLVGNILQGRPHFALASDLAGGRAAIANVARVMALVAILGHSIDLLKWETAPPETAAPNMCVTLLGANYRAPRPAVATATPAAHELPASAAASNETGADDTTINSRNGATLERDVLAIREAATVQGASTSHTNGEIAAPRANGDGQESLKRPARGSPSAARPPAAATDPPPTIPSGGLAQALALVQEGLRSMQALQQQTAEAHQRFLETQQAAQQAFASMLESHQRIVERSLGMAPLAPAALREVAPLTQAPAPRAQALETQPPVPIAPVISPQLLPTASLPETTPQSDSTISTTISAEIGPPRCASQTRPRAKVPESRLAPTLLEVVAELTGYPVEMLNLDMDMEADLGIDSIKRLEILSHVQRRLPELPAVDSQYLGSLRTLRSVVEHMEGGRERETANCGEAPAVESARAEGVVAVAGAGLSAVLLEVVAELTGYPVEMLNLDMDMEADLGIDSIKRLEILSHVQRRLPELPTVDSQFLGSLRTLRSIVEHMEQRGEPGAGIREESIVDGGVTGEAPAVLPDRVAADGTAQAARVEGGGGAGVPRRILKPVILPARGQERIPLAANHVILISDDGSALAEALARRLTERGAPARVIPAKRIAAGACADGVCGLVLLAPITDALSLGEGNSAEPFVKLSFELSRLMAASLRTAAAAGGALLATVARMDGSFGLSGGAFDPLHGALAGLAKTAADEWPEVSCRAIDVARDWPDVEAIAVNLAEELLSRGPIEVGLGPLGRHGLTLVEGPVRAGQREAVSGVLAALSPGDLVVVTGGARGVTPEAIVPLLAACRPAVLLLGRSPAPAAEPAWARAHADEASLKRAILENLSNGDPLTPGEVQREYRRIASNREVARNLRRLEATGATVMYRAVDVRDPIEVAGALNEARRRHGPIRGLIHGAGVIEDHRIEDKSREAFDRVFDTKVRGLAALLRAAEPDDLRFVVLFSSVSGRFGRRGQVDYAMANEALNKAAQRLATLRPSCRVVSLNWGPWDGGMVGPSLKREFERLGVGLISPEAGARALLDELAQGGEAVEVVVGAALPDGPGDGSRTRSAVGAPGRPPVASSGGEPRDGGLHVAFERRVDLASHPFLDSHRIAGKPVLPVAMMMEWLAHGALHDNPGLLLHGLSDFRLLKGVVLGGEPHDLRVLSSRPQRVNGHYEVAVELRGGPADRELLHARGRAILVDRLPSPPSASVRNGHTEPYPRDARRAYEEVLFHGPEFFAIEEVHGHSPQGIAARVRSSPAPETWMEAPLRSDWVGDPLVIDAGLQLGLLWSHEYLGGLCLPSRAAEYRQYCERFPRDGVTARLEVRGHDASRMVGDVVFVDAGGRVVAELEGSEWIVSPMLGKAHEAART